MNSVEKGADWILRHVFRNEFVNTVDEKTIKRYAQVTDTPMSVYLNGAYYSPHMVDVLNDLKNKHWLEVATIFRPGGKVVEREKLFFLTEGARQLLAKAPEFKHLNIHRLAAELEVESSFLCPECFSRNYRAGYLNKQLVTCKRCKAEIFCVEVTQDE